MPSMEMGSNGNASGAFLLMWLPMTIAMMLPLGMPVMLKFHTFVQAQLPQQQAWERSGIFVLGWLLPWALFGFAADLALFAGSVNSQLSHFQPINVIAMTLIAGLYQFTPLKLGFLKHHQLPCFTSSRQGVGFQAAF